MLRRYLRPHDFFSRYSTSVGWSAKLSWEYPRPEASITSHNKGRSFSSDVDIKTLVLPDFTSTDAFASQFPTMFDDAMITNWKVAPGDEFKAGDILCDIEYPTVMMEFKAEEDGVLAKILVDCTDPYYLDITPSGAPIALIVKDSNAYKEFLVVDKASS